MQYSQEHLKTMVYAKFGGQTECIMGNWKIENEASKMPGMLLGYIFEPRPKREEKTLRHVVMVAKFLDDTKPKIHLKSIFALFQISSILFNLI